MESNSCILYFIKCSKSLDSSQPLPLYVSSLLTLCILQGQLMIWYDLQTTIPAALNSPLIYMDTFVVTINNKNLNQLCYNSQNMLRWFSVCSSHMLSVVGIYIPLAGPQAACPAYRPRHYILLDLVDTQASANTVIFLCFDYTDCCCAMCPFESSEVVSHTSSFNLQLLVFLLALYNSKNVQVSGIYFVTADEDDNTKKCLWLFRSQFHHAKSIRFKMQIQVLWSLKQCGMLKVDSAVRYQTQPALR